MNKKTILSCIVLLFTLLHFTANSQVIKNSVLRSYVEQIEDTRKNLPVEKLYLQTDKPYYTIGDTLYFKSYLLNADYLTPSAQSGLLYVEIDNAANHNLKRIILPIAAGVCWGGIPLNDISQGSYILRAYTNWMRNFGEDYIFKKSIYITALKNSTLVTADFKLDTSSLKNNIQALLFFSTLNKKPLAFKNMLLRVRNGFQPVGRYSITTGIDGSAVVNFNLADKAQIKNLNILMQQKDKGADTTTLSIPVIFNRPEKTDLQFMPEGGKLVAGIPIKVGFKAIGENGKGISVSGTIVDSRQQTIASFKPMHNGMGFVELTPVANEEYYAKVLLRNGDAKNYPLPKVESTGTALQIVSKSADSLQLTICATPDLVNTSASQSFYLIGQARGVVCYAEALKLNTAIIKKTLAKKILPTGIARFTLLNGNSMPLNERIIYINHNDDLQITISPDRKSYSIRDSIGISLQVKDKNGKPVEGTFSMAVTDNSQTRKNKGESNLVNSLLFTSDLKGDVEEPGYYFEGTGKDLELDNLLLTQGWVGYSWKDVFALKSVPKYQPEKEFSINGKAFNIFNKPIKQTSVTLLRKFPTLVIDTVTDDNGRFKFTGNSYLPADSAFFFISVKNKRGKSFNVDVQVDEFAVPVFAQAARPVPWYVNTDTLILNNSHTKQAGLQTEAKYKGEGTTLEEVVIKAKKMIKGSQNSNPELDNEIYDEKELNEARTMSLFEVLGTKLPIIKINRGFYVINRHYQVQLIIDGKRGSSEIFMDYLTAKDIKGIEIIYVMTMMGYDIAVVYVTTYSGDSIYLKHTPGVYVYKPIPFNTPPQFYRPRYTVKNRGIAIGGDMRSTIHWEPNIITGKDGKATVSFFSADNPVDYTIEVEGTDLQGNLGSIQYNLKNLPESAP